MAALDRPAQRTNPILLIVIILIVISILLPLLPDVQQPWVAHVESKRGLSNVQKTSKCDKDPSAYLFWNPITQRYGKVCMINGQWFVVILDAAGRIITGFPKEKMADFAQVIQYMKNTGYSLIH